jgi:hypothetical protein
MPTPTFLTGFEHGIDATGATPVPNDRIWHTAVNTGGNPTTITTDFKSGARCIEFPATAASAAYRARNTSGTPGEVVASFYVKFVGSLPTADCKIFSFAPAVGSFCDVRFHFSTSTIRARVGATDGASGVAVVADTWYLIDCVCDVNSGTRTMDVRVNGTAAAQASAAVAASTVASWRIGKNTDTTVANGTIRFDNVVISETLADYPLGEHEVLKMSPNGDGTHSFTANDFIRGDAGAAILVSDTDVWQLVDDVPFGVSGTTDSVQQNVIRTTSYVEFELEPAPQAIDAWAIQVHGMYDADGTGADTSALKLNDGGTISALFAPPQGDVSNVAPPSTNDTFLTHCRATAPSGGVWTQAKLNALKLQWGFAGDVTGSPIVHALMVEVAYPVTVGGGGGQAPRSLHQYRQRRV